MSSPSSSSASSEVVKVTADMLNDPRFAPSSSSSGAAPAGVSPILDEHQVDLSHLVLSSSAEIARGEFLQNPEHFLQQSARDLTERLVHAVFRLPSERAMEGGRIVELLNASAREDVIQLPREKPVPKPRALTKWEQFAKLKGIKKRKRSRMVFDEVAQEWKPRYGYKRANDKSDNWLIEHSEGKPLDLEPGQDPWQKLRAEKKARVEKNTKKALKNQLRAAAAAAGAAGQRAPGAIDLRSTFVAKAPKRQQRKVKQKNHVDLALSTVQVSTASMGRFDSVRKGEPHRRKVRTGEGKRNALDADVREEKRANMNLFSRMFGAKDDTFDSGVAANQELRRQDAQRSAKKRAAGGGKKKKGKRRG